MLGRVVLKLPNRVHLDRRWRIHEVVPDFHLQDVWSLATPGGPDDFSRLVELFTSLDPARSPSRAVRTLLAIRVKIGAVFGWDDPATGAGSRVASLRDRLPADLLAGPTGPAFTALPAKPLFLLSNEWAAEVVNQTVHGIIHLGWVPDTNGGFRGEMAIYAKPDGLLGTAYMLAIRPFRYAIVYPRLTRDIEQRWHAPIRFRA